MYEQKAAWRLKYWPTPQDYNEAVQDLQINLQDSELRLGQVTTDRLGIPRPITGAFASVYKVHCAGKDWALRCFLRDVPDSCQRYSKISDFVQHDTLPYTVAFDYQQNGIKIGATWFPILKMEWVNGTTLDHHVHQAMQHGKLSTTLAERFKTICCDLRAAGIAHGDLQHGNIIVHNDDLYLVDYDGMYVPAMQGSLSLELGHRNYQHPQRNEQTFGPYLDNFSAWVIYTSLKALTVDPALYDCLGAGADCLLFRHEDFVNPLNSPAFGVLENHWNHEIQSAARLIRWQLECPPEQVPPLESWTPPPESLSPLAADVPTSRNQPRLVVDAPVSGLPEWMREGTVVTASTAGTVGGASAWKMEVELQNPTPRRLIFNEGAQVMHPWVLQLLNPLFWGLVFVFSHRELMHEFWPLVFILCLFEWSIWWEPLKHQRIVRNGKAVRGVVSKRQEGDPRGRTLYYVDYTFLREGDQHLDMGTMRVNNRQFDQLNENQEVTIVYLPGTNCSVIYQLATYCARL
jgi:hypothetical protein